jgi:FkbM family methyltransferase
MNHSYIDLYNIKSVLDIGANVGQFALEVLTQHPNIYILCIEANRECEFSLQNVGLNYIIACPSDKKDTRKFYKRTNEPRCSGNSLYLENTHYFSEDNVTVELVDTDTMDAILTAHRADTVAFDMIKLDTQGSELDILKGCNAVLKSAKLVLVETDVNQYNIGCPTQKDVVEYLNSVGFVQIDVVENHYHDCKLSQEDILFGKRDILI